MRCSTKEFGANKAETVNIREKINQKLEAVSLGNRKGRRSGRG